VTGDGERQLKPTGHRDLRVWQDAMALVRVVYLVTQSFPADEGAARRSKREFAQFLSVARGSLAVVETQSSLREIWDIWCKTMTFSPLFQDCCAPSLRS
jgi:hypothetical protein